MKVSGLSLTGGFTSSSSFVCLDVGANTGSPFKPLTISSFEPLDDLRFDNLDSQDSILSIESRLSSTTGPGS